MTQQVSHAHLPKAMKKSRTAFGRTLPQQPIYSISKTPVSVPTSGDKGVKGTSRQSADNEQRLSGGEVRGEKDGPGCGPCAPSLLIHGELALFADAASSCVLTPTSINPVPRDKPAPRGRHNYSAQLQIERFSHFRRLLLLA